MTESSRPLPTVVVAVADRQARMALTAELKAITADTLEIEATASGEKALKRCQELAAASIPVPVLFAERTLGAMSGPDLLLAMHNDERLRPTRKVLLTSRPSLLDVDMALNRGAVHGMLTRPWTGEGLERQLSAQLATYFTEVAPDDLRLHADLIDSQDVELADQRLAEQKAAQDGDNEDRDHFLLDPNLDEGEASRLLVEAIDNALGHPPRLRLATGTLLIDQDDEVGGIYIILEGRIKLSRRGKGDERLLHDHSTGPIVGLLSLAAHRRAFLRCRAATEVRALPLTIAQLGRALDADPNIGALLTRVLLASLARRLRRSDYLQLEVERLNQFLEVERDQLAEALSALKKAQEQLVANARMATLGEMASGIAHELNNPVAALERGIDHLRSDVELLLADNPGVRKTIHSAESSPPIGTAEQRQLRRSLAANLGDRALADRLVAAGITDTDTAAEVLASGDEGLTQLEAAHRLGTALRNTRSAGTRIGRLVNSLGAYLRGGDGRSPIVDDIDIAASIEDSLRLLGYRSGGVEVERRYSRVPAISARPGELQQVWTNLVSNALDAIDGPGLVTVSIDQPNQEQVRVQITDSGSGVAPELVEQIFEPRFTTRHGRVQYGLGLGLSLCRQIIDSHGGSIDLESKPGKTTVTVVLPVVATEDTIEPTKRVNDD